MSTIINRSGSTTDPSNTGFAERKVESAVKRIHLGRKKFSFASEAIAIEEANWNTAKKNKDIVVLFEVEVPENSSREPSIKEGRFSKKKTKLGINGVTYTFELSSEEHEALLSYNESTEYTTLFIETVNNELICEVLEDGSIAGRPMSSFIVYDNQDDALDEEDPKTKVVIEFKKHKKSILKPNFDLADLEGVYDLDIVVTQSTATSIKFSAKSWGEDVDNLTNDNFVLRDGGDNIITSTTFVGFDSVNKVYQITGTGFATGYTFNLDSVQEVGDVMYESTGVQTLTV